jgi:hypothetical protein
VKHSWRLTREQWTLSIARGLDNAPRLEIPSLKKSRVEINARLEVDVDRYPYETLMPMLLVTSMTQLFQLLVMIGLMIWFISWDTAPLWTAFAPVGFLALCLLVGRLYMRGYERVWAHESGRS